LLELKGVLSAPEGAIDADRAAPDTDDDDPAWQGDPRSHASEPRHGHARPGRTPPASAPEVAGAEQVGQQRRSLRELFRSLAKAVHPDQARHDGERERRTEVMKEVTRAYEDGDLARLLELESNWQTEQAVSEHSDSVARCRELERVNRELLDQVRRLTRQVRDMKREARDASMGLSPTELADQASSELDELEEICRFVEKFRDGRMTAAEFARGPRSLRRDDELELLEQLFADYSIEVEPAPARSRKRRA
jgi:ketosteroid isomerase-like protein